MSKYNNIKSIPIDSIPKREIYKAIKQWAEGDEAMEQLLLTCYDKKVVTGGCHAGAFPYISFDDQENFEKISGLLEHTQSIVGSQILMRVDGGNPFSGPAWFLPDIVIGLDTEYKDVADSYFADLNKILLEDNSKNIHVFFKLLDFFKGKESSLSFRIRHTNDNEFLFYIETNSIVDERYDYYKILFKNAGMEEYIDTNPEHVYMHEWKIQENNIGEFIKKIEDIAEYIINNYSYDVPQSENDVRGLLPLARYKLHTLSSDEFNEWLEFKKKEYGITSRRRYNYKWLVVGIIIIICIIICIVFIRGV